MRMEIKYYEISMLFLRVWLIIQLLLKNVLAVDVAKEEKGVIELSKGNETDLNSRMASMEAKSKKQEVKIDILTTLLEEEKKFTKQLNGRISKLESVGESSLKIDKLLERPKRPFRLIPPNIPAGKVKNKIIPNDETVAGFYGPPTNCKELAKLGYTLNGYYLVKNEDLQLKNNGGSKIEVVLCQFQLRPGKETFMEERVGFVSITSTQPSKTYQMPSTEKKLTAERAPDQLFNWKSEWTSIGPFVYADGCDFYGYDIIGGELFNVPSKEMCRDRCFLNIECTHIIWKVDVENGACLLKHGHIPPHPLSPKASQLHGGICGYFSTSRKT